MIKNESIGCTVPECRYHNKSENYCTLSKIEVKKHEPLAKTKECTDCGSFEKE